MPGWSRGNIKLQTCYEILFEEEHHQVGNSHDSVEDVKSLRKICNFVAEKLGYPNYEAYVSQNPGEAIIQMGNSTQSIIPIPKEKRPKKFRGLEHCVFYEEDGL